MYTAQNNSKRPLRVGKSQKRTTGHAEVEKYNDGQRVQGTIVGGKSGSTRRALRGDCSSLRAESREAHLGVVVLTAPAGPIELSQALAI